MCVTQNYFACNALPKHDKAFIFVAAEFVPRHKRRGTLKHSFTTSMARFVVQTSRRARPHNRSYVGLAFYFKNEKIMDGNCRPAQLGQEMIIPRSEGKEEEKALR